MVTMTINLPGGFDGVEDGAGMVTTKRDFLEFEGMKLVRFAETGGTLTYMGKKVSDGKTHVYKVEVFRQNVTPAPLAYVHQNGHLLFMITGYQTNFARLGNIAVAALRRFLKERRRHLEKRRRAQTKKREVQ